MEAAAEPATVHPSYAAALKRIHAGFHPEEHGLPSVFLLTRHTQMKGCGCKVPRNILLELLKAFGEGHSAGGDNEIGIGLDSCVVPLRQPGLFLIQTTDFFYPLVDDPFLMGRITCANVLSDVYAMGVTEVDNMLMLLGVATEMNEPERNVVVQEFIRGFEAAATEAETRVRGGQTVRCPWLLLGGVATSVCSKDEFIKVDEARPGDLLVLTKPIGGQVAVNAMEWLQKKTGRVEQLGLEEGKIRRLFQQACEQMARLNRNAARTARKHGAHASTDVTGFGILGHADNLARAQQRRIRFVIDRLPIIEYAEEISRRMDLSGSGAGGFNLFAGISAETSGGLLVALPEEKVEPFMRELEELDGRPCWVVGRVEAGEDSAECSACIIPNPEIIVVPSGIHD